MVHLKYTVIGVRCFEGFYWNNNNGYWEGTILIENEYSYPLKDIKVRFNDTIVRKIPVIQGCSNEIITVKTPLEYLKDNTIKQIGVDYFSSIEVYGYK